MPGNWNYVKPDAGNIDELFEGVMIPGGADKPSGYPGWRCRGCGWTVGSIGLPPTHNCPQDGLLQVGLLRVSTMGARSGDER